MWSKMTFAKVNVWTAEKQHFPERAAFQRAVRDNDELREV